MENLPAVEFKPKAKDKQAEQGILIACRGMEQFAAASTMIAQALASRADQILLDYSQQGVAVRFRVDGLWEAMPAMEALWGMACWSFSKSYAA